jgi:hypothetical protein
MGFAKGKSAQPETIEVDEITLMPVDLHIVGRTALVQHRMSSKAMRELTLPSLRKNKAEKESSLKHDPVTEFRNACYVNRNPSEPALFHIPAGAFKAAMASAAIDLPGIAKAKLERLVSIQDTQINLFGKVYLRVDICRLSGMTKTPDPRFRPCFPEWACKLRLLYPKGLIQPSSIVNLMAAAGVFSGIGEWRSGRGSGGFGSFRVVNEDDEDYLRITSEQGRDVQAAMLADPVPYDEDTEELLAWYDAEINKRHAVPVPTRRTVIKTKDVPEAAE